jgi:hypothetical protein
LSTVSCAACAHMTQISSAPATANASGLGIEWYL